MALLQRLAGLLRSPQRRGLQQMAVLQEEGELIGYWTRPDSAAGPAAGVAAAPMMDHNKCRVVRERFNLPPLPASRWEEEATAAAVHHHGGRLSGGSILVPKM